MENIYTAIYFSIEFFVTEPLRIIHKMNDVREENYYLKYQQPLYTRSRESSATKSLPDLVTLR